MILTQISEQFCNRFELNQTLIKHYCFLVKRIKTLKTRQKAFYNIVSCWSSLRV